MSVIPLTLTISLCLVFTFVLFFLKEYGRERFSSAESDALLPLADETPKLATARTAGGEGDPCGCSTGERPPCAGCLRQSHQPNSANAT